MLFFFFKQIHLDIKYTSDPEIKLPIVILPEVPAVKQPPAPAGFGFEAFGSPNQPVWNTTPQQGPQPMDPPPPYGAYAMYPPNSHSDKDSYGF